jgi:hypothetical protein
MLLQREFRLVLAARSRVALNANSMNRLKQKSALWPQRGFSQGIEAV